MSTLDNEIPQWKRELIARLRNQNNRTASVQQLRSDSDPPQRMPVAVEHPSVQQPAVVRTVEKCDAMVQDRGWDMEPKGSDSEEDLRYGPGIVNKLKNRYLSLALRDNVKTRPSILPMRRAASMENILNEDIPKSTERRLFQSKTNGSNDTEKNVPNRYRSATGGSDLKRARSVEIISTSEDRDIVQTRPKSLHEEMLLITEGNDKSIKTHSDKTTLETTTDSKHNYSKINRPKRIAPVLNEKEKPPLDFVKQTKRKFERRPELRTKAPQQTGEVAAKVATFQKNFTQNGFYIKPPLLLKPRLNGFKPNKAKREKHDTPPLSSPIPDVSRIDFQNTDSDDSPKNTSLSETPDLILTSTPIIELNSPTFRKISSETFIIEEKRHSTPASPTKKAEDNEEMKRIPTQPLNNIKKEPSTTKFNFASPSINTKVLNTHTPPSEQLRVEVNGDSKNQSVNAKPNLTSREIEKNLKNAAKTLEQPHNGVNVRSVEEVIKVQVPKVKRPTREPENNSMRFNFTDRVDVPDYVPDDGLKNIARKIEKPKVGEGGIIVLPGGPLGESFTDEDEEIMRSLEAPPSPCDVSFINDNILIDGKSSLSQKTTKRNKLKISFVDSGPDVYEYPSESSLCLEDLPVSSSPTTTSHLGHTVPSLSGTSSLANYTPKTTEHFQPGITRSAQNIPNKSSTEEPILNEVEEPVLFSAGTSSDILF